MTSEIAPGKGDPSSKVGLTTQQLWGMPARSWVLGGMETSKTIAEILVV